MLLQSHLSDEVLGFTAGRAHGSEHLKGQQWGHHSKEACTCLVFCTLRMECHRAASGSSSRSLGQQPVVATDNNSEAEAPQNPVSPTGNLEMISIRHPECHHHR